MKQSIQRIIVVLVILLVVSNFISMKQISNLRKDINIIDTRLNVIKNDIYESKDLLHGIKWGTDFIQYIDIALNKDW